MQITLCLLGIYVNSASFQVGIKLCIAPIMAKEPYPSETADRYIVRFPEGMRERLKQAAADNNRSMNSEIIARLETSFGMEMPLVQGAVNTAQLVKALAEALSQRDEFINDLAKQFEERNIAQIKHRASDIKTDDK